LKSEDTKMTWVEISSVVDGMVMVEEIDEEVEEVA
jgi:hypothetical protein